MQKVERKQTGVRMNPEIYKRLKHKALLAGATVSDVIENCVVTAMEGKKEDATVDEFINQEMAAAILGRSAGGNIPKLLSSKGVSPVGIVGRSKLYRKKEVELLAQEIKKKATQVAGQSNGGKLLSEIKTLKSLIKSLEARVEKIETFVDQF